MKIILLNGQEALLVDDKQPVVTLVNEDEGCLVLNGKRIEIKPGETENPVVENAGTTVRAHFEDKRGVRWRVLRPRLSANGVPYSSVDYMAEYIKMRVYLDKVDRKTEELCSELLSVRAMIEPDSLGIINIGG